MELLGFSCMMFSFSYLAYDVHVPFLLHSFYFISVTYCLFFPISVSLYIIPPNSGNDMEPLILLRIVEVLQSAYKAGHVPISKYIGFLVTQVARFKVFPGKLNHFLAITSFHSVFFFYIFKTFVSETFLYLLFAFLCFIWFMKLMF